MTKFMTDSRLLKTPSHKPKKTDMNLWKLSSKEYYSKLSDERIRVYKCPMAYRCNCRAKCRVSEGKTYVRLEFHGTHDVNSHATERSKELLYKQIIAVHDAVIIAPNQSTANLQRIITQQSSKCESRKAYATGSAQTNAAARSKDKKGAYSSEIFRHRSGARDYGTAD
jgi:hypothetical protein